MRRVFDPWRSFLIQPFAEVEAMAKMRDRVLGLSEAERSEMCTIWLDGLQPVDLLRYLRGNSGDDKVAEQKLLNRCALAQCHIRRNRMYRCTLAHCLNRRKTMSKCTLSYLKSQVAFILPHSRSRLCGNLPCSIFGECRP